MVSVPETIVGHADWSKPWQIVVGEAIDYGAIASSDCDTWDWDMENGTPDVWNPGGTTNVKNGGWSTSHMWIGNNDLPSDSNWDHFGLAYGTVTVTCEDGEDNEHIFYSTTIPQKAKVFFDPTLTTHPGGGSPNWFYYWKYSLFGNISNVTWTGRDYGYTSQNGDITIGDATNADYATAYNHTAIYGYARPTADGKSKIDLLYCMLTHELQHREDFTHVGQGDDDDGDFLPNAIDPYPNVKNGAQYGEYVGEDEWRGDWEWRGRLVENVVAPAAKDWSKGGKQW